MAVQYRASKYLEGIGDTGIGTDNHFGEVNLREVQKVCSSMVNDICKVYGCDDPKKLYPEVLNKNNVVKAQMAEWLYTAIELLNQCCLPLMSGIYPANYRSPRTRANSSELARTRANSARVRHQFADTYTPPNSAERSPEYAERSPEYGGVRPSSPGFARTPPRTGERFARKFVRGKKSRPPLTSVRRGSPRTWFAANVVRRE